VFLSWSGHCNRNVLFERGALCRYMGFNFTSAVVAMIVFSLVLQIMIGYWKMLLCGCIATFLPSKVHIRATGGLLPSKNRWSNVVFSIFLASELTFYLNADCESIGFKLKNRTQSIMVHWEFTSSENLELRCVCFIVVSVSPKRSRMYCQIQFSFLNHFTLFCS